MEEKENTPKVSVLIIAHNEEKNLGECLHSVLMQSKKPDEVLVIIHNSTDGSYDIAASHAQWVSSVRVVRYNGNQGVVHARIRGLQEVSGDVILCLDGDSVAQRNWVKVMTETLLANNNRFVGSYVKFRGTLLGNVQNFMNRFRTAARNDEAAGWIWGPSMGLHKRDAKIVISTLETSIGLSKKLVLSRNPDDIWVTRVMVTLGNIEVTNRTFVTIHTKESSSIALLQRTVQNVRDRKKIDAFTASKTFWNKRVN